MIRALLIAAAASLVLGACHTEDVPAIQIVEVVSGTLDPADDARDDLVVRIRYRDGDGDLGGGQVIVHDCRDAAFTSHFDLPPIVNPRGLADEVVIEGELVVTVRDVEAIETAPSRPTVCAEVGAEPTAFCVTVEDAAGNLSEPACTGAVGFVAPT